MTPLTACPTLPCEITVLALPRPLDPPTPSAASGSPPPRPARPSPVRERKPGGRYDLVARLGAGSMGVVYQAIDRCLERPVALKLLRGGDPEKSRRFVREARLLARLDHPNLPRVYDAGRLGGRPFVALELVAGPTLREAARSLSLAEKLTAVLGLLDGLAAVHAAGLVHRDVKPSNVVLGRRPDGSPRPCLVDFGIAREAAAEDGSETGAVLGTPAYLAPEQAAAGAVDHRADLWAVGAVLYEILSGEPPFGEGDSAKLIRRVLAEEVRPLRQVKPDVPADLEAVVMRCLAKVPQARPPSAEALAEELRRLLARPTPAEPGDAPPEATGSASLRADPPGPRRSRRPLRKSALRLLAAGILAAMAWVPLWRAGNARADEPGPSVPHREAAEVERLVEEVAALTGESTTEAIHRALEQRRDRLSQQR